MPFRRAAVPAALPSGAPSGARVYCDNIRRVSEVVTLHVLPMSNRTVKVERSYLIPSPEEGGAASKFVDACF